MYSRLDILDNWRLEVQEQDAKRFRVGSEVSKAAIGDFPRLEHDFFSCSFIRCSIACVPLSTS